VQKLRRRVQTSEAEAEVWSRLAHADSQSDCEKSVKLTGARATLMSSARVLIEFAFLIKRKFCC
jgi:hypothetical protein